MTEAELEKLSSDDLRALLRAIPAPDRGTPTQFRASIPIRKIDEEQRLVFGFASIVEQGGQEVIDLDGETIAIAEIEKAAYEFLERSREAGRMHESLGHGHVVESFVITAEKAEALRGGGVLKGDFDAAGWWIGFRVTDDDTWEEVKKGRLPMFSIGGAAERIPEEA
jgi:hypothetical protein